MEKKDESRRLERRTMGVRELRADGESGKIEGYASVFNEETDLGYFREVVRPGAFKRAINEGQDVRALWNHDPNYVLGRTTSGTLELAEDRHGLKITIDPPDTQFARDLVKSIDRGDVDQMSFAFVATEEAWTERKDETDLRELIDVDLYDVSPVTYPAYEGTSVGLRSAEAIYNDHVESLGAQVLTDDADADDRAQVLADAQRRVNLVKL